MFMICIVIDDQLFHR